MAGERGGGGAGGGFSLALSAGPFHTLAGVTQRRPDGAEMGGVLGVGGG